MNLVSVYIYGRILISRQKKIHILARKLVHSHCSPGPKLRTVPLSENHRLLASRTECTHSLCPFGIVILLACPVSCRLLKSISRRPTLLSGYLSEEDLLHTRLAKEPIRNAIDSNYTEQLMLCSCPVGYRSVIKVVCR